MRPGYRRDRLRHRQGIGKRTAAGPRAGNADLNQYAQRRRPGPHLCGARGQQCHPFEAVGQYVELELRIPFQRRKAGIHGLPDRLVGQDDSPQFQAQADRELLRGRHRHRPGTVVELAFE